MEVAPDGVWGGMLASNQHNFVWGAPLSVQDTLELSFSAVGLSSQILSQNLCVPFSPFWTILSC